MHDDVAIKLEKVSKAYRLFDSKHHRLKEALHPFRKTYHREFLALRDVSLTIPKGKTVGILGMNGSGKSTLLQIISSVLQPTSGTVKVAGKVAALLELGAGFNPDLTARENLIINCTILGLPRSEILRRMPEVEEFADIGEFFDQPMKTYSSGMYMRVAFAGALYVDPDILITDEALAVGDARFQEKCTRRFSEFQKAGKTIIIVTHDRSTVPRLCDMGILLHKGQVVEVGDPRLIVDLYSEILQTGALPRRLTGMANEDEPAAIAAATAPAAPMPADVDPVAEEPLAGDGDEQLGEEAAQFLAAALPDDVCHTNPLYNPYEYRLGNEDAKIVDFLVLNERAANPGVVYAGSVLDIYVKVHFEKAFEAPLVGLQFKTKDGVIVFGTHSGWLGATTAAVEAGSVHCYRFRVKADLVASTWFMNLAVAKDEGVMCDWRCSIANIELVDERRTTGYARLNTAFQAMT